MAGKGAENLGRGIEPIKATNNRTNDVGLKDFETDLLGKLNEGKDESKKVVEQLDELKRNIEKDEGNAENNESNEDQNKKSDDDQSEDISKKFKLEGGTKIKAEDLKRSNEARDQVTLKDLLANIVQGLELPPGKAKDLANEALAIADSNMTPQEMEANFSAPAIKLYTDTERFSSDIPAREEDIKKIVIETLSKNA